ncbi:MAG: exodeoxyribonuclease VII small subunit [Bacillota bacterium]
MEEENPRLSFEQAIKELEETVSLLESGELGLEESLAAFEKGMSLVRICQEKLDEAETKIAKLVEMKNGSLATEPFRLEEGAG